MSAIGLGATVLPENLWSQVQEDGAQRITKPMLENALAMSGLSFPEEDQTALLQAANQNLTRFEGLRNLKIPNDVAPPFYFSPIVPGMKINRTRHPVRFSMPRVRRPANLEEVAFWPIADQARLIRTRQVSSVELTRMYLARLHRYNEKLNFVVTFLDDVALAQAKQADAEIRRGKYKGPLHGIPWGAKDIIAVKGYKTTWGSAVHKDQTIDEEASVVEMLRDAGAVLLAKLTSGELAQGDRWYGGQTMNPWKVTEGSSGSSAGPASAAAAGCVAFAIGSETSGSILSPSARCGATGLRPTFGRVSRHGVMALSWTQDRLGPLCRCAEDCAIVMTAISRPDDRDMSVVDIPFNWNPRLSVRHVRVGYLKDGFDETRDPVAKRNEELAMAQMQKLGFQLVPVKVPEGAVDASGFAVESAVFFDEMIRSGRDKQLASPQRGNGFRAARLVPAVEYLQAQRARTMMMMKLAEATADVDVYLVPANSGGGGGGRGGRGAAPAAAAAVPPAARPNTVARHFNMANLACYPAVSVPNGFTEEGTPTALTFYARPFGETELLAVVKAYQDASKFHLRRPPLEV